NQTNTVQRRSSLSLCRNWFLLARLGCHGDRISPHFRCLGNAALARGVFLRGHLDVEQMSARRAPPRYLQTSVLLTRRTGHGHCAPQWVHGKYRSSSSCTAKNSNGPL